MCVRHPVSLSLWTTEGRIHSQRGIGPFKSLLEKLFYTHVNLVLRECLDDPLHHLLPWDIEFLVDETVDDPVHEIINGLIDEELYVPTT